MKRQMIKINKELCNGCGLCVEACHEGAIQLQNGKAVLTRDDYCDGLGNCLPVCPVGAITFETREAAPFDEKTVKNIVESNATEQNCLSKRSEDKMFCGCPSSQAQVFNREQTKADVDDVKVASELRQFPIQIQLVPSTAPYFNNADVLVAADCTAFAYGDFHRKFIKGRITLIGCPKLDRSDYSEKLTEILRANDIKSLTVVRMEVPCCGGIVEAVKVALKNSEKLIPWSIITVLREGQIVR